MNITHIIKQMPEYQRAKQRQEQGSPAQEAEQDEPQTPDASAPAEGSTAYNDDRNATDFIDRFHEEIRYCWSSDSWHQWSGIRWKPHPSKGVMHLARQFCRELRQEAQTLPDKKARKDAVRRARDLGNKSRMVPMVDLATLDARVSVADAALWDAHPMLLGLENGMVDLRTGQFLPPDRQWLMTKCCDVSHDAGAACPKWESFVQRILPDPEVRRFMQISAGYWLSGDTSAQIFWFLYGAGANGKSTFLEIISRIGGDYARRAGNSMLSVTTNNREASLELSTLPGVRLLVGSEMGDGMRLNTELLKDMTGEDTLTARAHYESHFNFKPTCKLVMFGNHKPVITDTDGGIWRRPRLIPFTQVIPEAERNLKLKDELWEERSGILNWCLEGLRLWRQEGLTAPASVISVTESFRESSDILGEFLREHTQAEPGGRLLLKDLYARYTSWCNCTGHRGVLSDQKLRSRLEERGLDVALNKHGRVIMNMSLKPSDDPFDNL
ncbi:MAG: phage/plasmid primase, P4 family [Verrucomicrobium sp.]|nr:phage/plasmid primase, P4 family [Verrucomicrobium sp.]